MLSVVINGYSTLRHRLGSLLLRERSWISKCSFRGIMEVRRAVTPQVNGFIAQILGLIEQRVGPTATERVAIAKVVDRLTSALRQASPRTVQCQRRQVAVAPGETAFGDTLLNQIVVWRFCGVSNERQLATLEILENRTGSLHLHCCVEKLGTSNTSVFMKQAKLIPHYALWDPVDIWRTRTCIETLSLSGSEPWELVDARFSYDGDSGISDARVVQSISTSLNIVASFGLWRVRIDRTDLDQTVYQDLVSQARCDRERVDVRERSNLV